jgi:serine/threonine protein kinase
MAHHQPREADPSTNGEEGFDPGAPRRRIPFGKYLLLGLIARGGMAEIYRSRSATGNSRQLLAIKCMRAHLAKESRFVEMFIREGKLAMMLQHDGIVRTYDVGSVNDRFFITMEYIAGKDLNNLLRRCQETGRRVPVPHALHIALKVCRALHYAHTLNNERGEPLNIVNRDVSPSNIRITYDGEVKLLDFGIAQAVLQISSEIGILKGKFSYMSPEQVRGLPLDHRTDIFSAGIVLHEMLACERLFKDDSEFVLMEKVRRAEVKPPSTFNRRVPEQLDAIVLRALSREPSARFQDAEAMAQQLEHMLEGYQFSPTELGEFIRGLFPSDYANEQSIKEACFSDEPLKPSEVTPAEREESSERQRPKRTRKHRRQPDPEPSRNPTLWVLSVVLLLAGIVILVLALR